MAIVTRVRVQGRPSSSEISTSQTCVVRPLWRRRPTAWALPWLLLGDGDMRGHLAVAQSVELQAIQPVKADNHPAVEVFEGWARRSIEMQGGRLSLAKPPTPAARR